MAALIVSQFTYDDYMGAVSYALHRIQRQGEVLSLVESVGASSALTSLCSILSGNMKALALPHDVAVLYNQSTLEQGDGGAESYWIICKNKWKTSACLGGQDQLAAAARKLAISLMRSTEATHSYGQNIRPFLYIDEPKMTNDTTLEWKQWGWQISCRIDEKLYIHCADYTIQTHAVPSASQITADMVRRDCPIVSYIFLVSGIDVCCEKAIT
eukprot:scaffold165727_cov19-Prasinocladus_malaysianus.AAC.1